MSKVKLVIFILFLYIKSGVQTKNRVECGYKQCPPTRDGALNVHLIPHSHMDAGWVKTFDEYYYGTKTTVSAANVHLIYHSVLTELLHDRRRRFTLSETAYFWRWWKEQRPATRSTFRTLVQEGRVEFAGGGWVQNDEATLDYLQIIDQFTWGLRKLNDTLGPCGKPRAAWQIDVYGHTREQASLLAQMGYDGLFIGRVDYSEREAMIEEDRMEFMWRGSDVLGKMSDIMTHNLFNLYNAPDGFCFDFLCTDEPIVDDPDSKVYNADKRVNDFIAQIERQAKYYEHDNILVTMGGDFTYQSAANWFMNMDKLINHVNTHPANLSDINIFYSSPSCYLKAIYLYGRRDKAVFTEKEDYLPYGSDASTYWTGFYTSRPALKYLARRAHMFLQVVKQLTVVSGMGDSYELHLLRHAVGLVLHHDALTGTSQQHVTNDFVRTLTDAMDACSKKVSNILSYLTPTWGNNRRKNNQQFIVCHQLNISQCRTQFTETQDSMLLLVYNPSSVKTYHYVRLPAIALRYSIRDANDDEVEYQLVPLPAAVVNLPGRNSLTVQELIFEAEGVPPLGYSSYYITPVRDQLEENDYMAKAKTNPEGEHEMMPQISNEYLKVTVNKDTGLLESIQHVDGFKLQMSQNFYYYSQLQQPLQSGAYSFRPSHERPTPVSERIMYHAVRGNLVKEIRQKFSEWISQTVRLYRGEEFVELEWVVGPVPLGTDLGKEVVTIFSTNISNNGEFYTDSNGRQMMKRSCWNDTTAELRKKPVAACYYPVTSQLCIQSRNTSVGLCVLPDRPQGGTSYSEGQLELMVHRRLLTDDGFGLEEALNEDSHGVGLTVRGRHRIVFGNFRQPVEDMTFFERTSHAARRMAFEPWLFLSSGEKINRRKWQSVRNKKLSALRPHGLPRHVHLLTLEPWKGGSALLRLENVREGKARDGTSADYTVSSSYATVELRRLFGTPRLAGWRETTLAANQWLDQARQMDWSTRYVYNGGDDGILQEDMVEDYSREPSTPYSYEQSEYITKPPLKMKSKMKHPKNNSRTKPRSRYDYNRRRRSVNDSYDVRDNIINNSTEDGHLPCHKENSTTNASFAEVRTKKNVVPEKILENLTGINRDNVTYIVKDPSHRTVRNKATLGRTRNINEKLNQRKIKRKDTEEVRSSEEDFSMNLKKKTERGRRNWTKSRRIEADLLQDDIDDGVTKSIYEMYYKTKPRKNSFKPYMRDSDEIVNVEHSRRKVTGKNNRKHRVEEEDRINNNHKHDNYRYETSERKPHNQRKDKSMHEDRPFVANNYDRRIEADEREYSTDDHKQRNENEEDLEDGIDRLERETTPVSECVRNKRRLDHRGEDYDGYEKDRDDEETGRIRTKRTAEQDDNQPEINVSPPENSEDPEYLVTLRPGQIRTFVVWFEK